MMMLANASAPPTAPPAIAPTFLESDPLEGWLLEVGAIFTNEVGVVIVGRDLVADLDTAE
jgi:hypothetical protein